MGFNFYETLATPDKLFTSGDSAKAEKEGWLDKLDLKELQLLADLEKHEGFELLEKIIKEKRDYYILKAMQLVNYSFEQSALILAERRGHYNEGKAISRIPKEAKEEINRRNAKATTMSVDPKKI